MISMSNLLSAYLFQHRNVLSTCFMTSINKISVSFFSLDLRANSRALALQEAHSQHPGVVAHLSVAAPADSISPLTRRETTSLQRGAKSARGWVSHIMINAINIFDYEVYLGLQIRQYNKVTLLIKFVPIIYRRTRSEWLLS